tara:strand:+ start:7280 stop:7492 length:213 start_codon:yes stop_codon:yes gene_type:complete
MGDFVDLSSPTVIARRKGLSYERKKDRLAKEYRGLTLTERARKAANLASDNGRLWWLWDYVYKYYMRIIK